MIAILLINYNSDNLTINCINSIFKFEVKNEFIIAVLDNSEISSNLLSNYIKLSPNFEKISYFFPNKNLGFSGGIEYLYEKLKYKNIDFFYILNNDCIVNIDTIDNIVNHSSKNIDTVYSSKILLPNNNTWFEGGIYNDFLGITRHVPYSEFSASNKKFLSGCAILIPSLIIKKIGLFDKKFFLYGEDLDYSIRLIREGYKLDICLSSIVNHSVGGSSKTKSFAAYYNYVTNTVGAFIHRANFFKSILILFIYLLKSFYLMIFEMRNIKNNLGHVAGLYNAYVYFFNYKEIINFLFFGFIVSSFQIIINILFVDFFNFDEIISYRITYIPVVYLSYFLHSNFTFNSNSNLDIKFPLFLLQSIFSYFIGEIIYSIFLMFVNYKISLLGSILLTAFFSFYFNKIIVFGKVKRQ